MEKKVLFIGLVVIVLVVLAYWLVSPLFVNERVDEELPSSLGSDNSESIVELEGSFIDADSFHKTSGFAKVVKIDGKRYLSLENFKTTNGPDLYVYLSTDTGTENFVNLGELRGNVGNQNYEIPDDIELGSYDNVLIWCRAFGVLFGSAELE